MAVSLEQEIVQEQARSANPLLRVTSGGAPAPAPGGVPSATGAGPGGDAAPQPSAPLKGLLKPPPEERKRRKVSVCWASDSNLEQVRVFHKKKVPGNDDVIVAGPMSSTDPPEVDTDIPAMGNLQAHLKVPGSCNAACNANRRAQPPRLDGTQRVGKCFAC